MIFKTIAADNLVLSFVAFAFAFAALTMLSKRTLAKCRWLHKLVTIAAGYGLATWISISIFGPRWTLLIPLLIGISVTVVVTRAATKLSFNGSFLMATLSLFYAACLVWVLALFATASIGEVTRIMMLVLFVFLVFYLTVALVQRLEQLEVISRHVWRNEQSVVPVVPVITDHRPKVSLHVPAYSEPPNIVIATLDALAILDYPNYEVLVIDNNTRDPSLWQPVQAHCQRLGPRFHFFHIDCLAGAKAGALNFALRHTSYDAELVGVVDADYKVERNFLATIIGYFTDPNIAFVQTAQAYRDWERHPYLRMCNWEYTVYLASNLVSRNEREAAITLGTMGLIRRRLLEEIGGWAEWCVTEDSEIAPRIHTRGYKSMYLSTILGRGLIPERFGDYKKQRFRWSYGAVQELRRHFRFYLPTVIGGTATLTAMQKISHLMHALDTLKSGLELLILASSAALAATMLLDNETVELPVYAWAVFAGAVILAFLLKALVFHTLRWSFRDTLGAILAHSGLDHTIGIAGIAGLLTRSIAWRRTNKFRAVPNGMAAFRSVIPELLFAGAISVASIALLIFKDLQGLLLLLLIGGLLKVAKYLLAPILVILAENGIRQRAVALAQAKD